MMPALRWTTRNLPLAGLAATLLLTAAPGAGQTLEFDCAAPEGGPAGAEICLLRGHMGRSVYFDGISADGNVLYGYAISDGTVAIGSTAFRWRDYDRGEPFQLLGHLANDLNNPASAVRGISDDGRVLAGMSLVDEVSERAFRWVEDATGGVPGNPRMQDLGTLGPTCGDDEWSQAWGLSGDGRVVVGVSTRSSGDRCMQRAFRWAEDATSGPAGNRRMQDLGSLDGMHTGSSRARAASDDGTIVVGSSEARAFRWIEGGTAGVAENPQMQDLGTLDDRLTLDQAVSAVAVNGSGTIVAGDARSLSDSGSLRWRAFRWVEGATDGATHNPQMQDLGALASLGHFSSHVSDISRNGRVIVGWSFGTGGFSRAFRWVDGETTGDPQNPQMQDLGVFPGHREAHATGVSADGRTVTGFSRDRNNNTFPVIWRLPTGAPPVEPERQLEELPRWALGGHIGQVANSLSDSTPALSADAFDINLPTVVITHGWQPSGSFSQDALSVDFLRTMFENINAAYNQPERTVNVLLYTWQGAFVKPPGRAHTNAQAAGAILAGRITSLIGGRYNNYRLPIHFVGHSMGTRVNYHAVMTGNRGYRGVSSFRANHFTILDAPTRQFSGMRTEFENLWRVDRLYLENYWGTLRSFGPWGSGVYVGERIDSAELNGGYALYADHSGVWQDFYADSVLDRRTDPNLGGFHYSAALMAQGDFLRRPGDSPPPIYHFNENLILSPGPVSRYSAFDPSLQTLTLSTRTAQQGQARGANTRGADGYAVFEIAVPTGATLLKADIWFGEPGNGDWLEVSFEEVLLGFFEGRLMSEEGGTGGLDISEFAGQTGHLSFRLISRSAAPSEVEISNLRFVLDQFEERAPTTTALTGPASSTLGQPITLSATVTPESDALATGTVTFRNGDTEIGTATLTNGTATLQMSGLPVGQHSLTAFYEGSDAHQPSSSAPLLHTVAGLSVAFTGGGAIFGQTVQCGPALGSASHGVTVSYSPAELNGLPSGVSITWPEGSEHLALWGTMASGGDFFGGAGRSSWTRFVFYPTRPLIRIVRRQVTMPPGAELEAAQELLLRLRVQNFGAIPGCAVTISASLRRAG